MIRVECPAGRAAARAWAAGAVLGGLLGQDWELAPRPDAADWRLTLDGAAGELRLPDTLLGCAEHDWLRPASLPRLPLAQWDLPAGLRHTDLVPAGLPVLYGAPASGGSWLTALGDGAAAGHGGVRLDLGLDVFGAALFLLARYEEYALPDRDAHGRFPAARSVLSQAGALERPLLSEYAEVLWKLMRQLWPGLSRPPRAARTVPTHDVDVPWGVYRRSWPRLLRSAVADALQRRDVPLAWRRLAHAGRVQRGELEQDVNNTFGWIMQQSEQRGLASTFYFLIDDAEFPIEHPWVLKLLQAMHARGHRIGVHPPLGTAHDPAALAAAVGRFRAALRRAGLPGLADSPLHGRQHYLQWDPAATWPAYCAAGLGSDSSCGFAQRIGFRAGVGQPYAAFDLRTEQALPLTEEPLLAMEASLLAPVNEGLPLPEAARRMVRLGRVCRAFGGDFVLLWHNDSLISRAQQAAYCAVLDGLADDAV